MITAPDDKRPSAGWFEGREHCLPIRVYYEDTDFTGLVYHANYVRYFERGRSDFLRVVGADHSLLLDREDPAAQVDPGGQPESEVTVAQPAMVAPAVSAARTVRMALAAMVETVAG